MRSTILVFSIAIGFAFAATADQVVPEDADYALDDDLVEAHAKVQAMMAAGKTLAECRKLEDATKKDIEDAVRDGQKLLDSLPRGDHCENTGQGAVKLAQEAKEKADKHVITTRTAITTAQSAHVKISSRSFSSIIENECSWAFSSTAYTTAQATYKKAVKEHEIAVGRAGEAAKAVASAIAEAKQGKHDCLCKTQYDHTETFKRLSKDNTKNQKDWTFAFKLECVHSGKKVCKIPACPTVKPGDMTKFQFLKCMLKGGKTSVEMKLKGQGCCRYPGWNPAKNKGYMSEKDCMMECLKDRSCNAADIARPKNGKYDCFLFTHGTHATVMKTLTTQCNVKSATEKCFYKHHEETAAPSTMTNDQCRYRNAAAKSKQMRGKKECQEAQGCGWDSAAKGGGACLATNPASNGKLLNTKDLKLDITGLAKVLNLDATVVTDMVDKLGAQIKGYAGMASSKIDDMLAKFDDATKGISVTFKLPVGKKKIPITFTATQLSNDDNQVCECDGGLGFGLAGTIKIAGKSSIFPAKGDLSISATFSNTQQFEVVGKFSGSAGISMGGASLDLDTINVRAKKCNNPVSVTFKSTGKFTLPLLKDPIEINALDGEYKYGDGWGVHASMSGKPLGVDVDLSATLAKKGVKPLVLIASIGFPNGVDLKKLPLLKSLPGADKLPLVGEGAKFEQTFFPSADPFFEAYNAIRKVGGLTLENLKAAFPLPKSIGSLRDLGDFAKMSLDKKVGKVELEMIAMLGKLGKLGKFSGSSGLAAKLKGFHLGGLGSAKDLGNLADLMASGKFSPSLDFLEKLVDLSHRVKFGGIDLKGVNGFELAPKVSIGSLGSLGKLIMSGKLNAVTIGKIMQLGTLAKLGIAKLGNKLQDFAFGALGKLKQLGKLGSIALAGKLGHVEVSKLADISSMGVLGKACASIPIPQLPETIGITLSGKDLCTIPAVTIDPPIKATIPAPALKVLTGTKATSVEGSVGGMIDIKGKKFDLNFGVKITPTLDAEAGSEKYISLKGASANLAVKYNKKEGFVADFVAKGEIGIRGANPIKITLSGNYAKAKKMCLQAFGEGEAWKTKANVLVQACKDPAEKKAKFLSTVCLPEGVVLKNLPGINKIPMIEKVPKLGNGACVNIGNIIGKLSQLTDKIKNKLGSLGKKKTTEQLAGAKLPNFAAAACGTPLGDYKLGKLGKLCDFGKLGGYAFAGKIGKVEMVKLVEFFELGKLGKLNALKIRTFQIGQIGTASDFGKLGERASKGAAGMAEISALKKILKAGRVGKLASKIGVETMDLNLVQSRKFSLNALADFGIGALGKISKFGKLAEMVLDGEWQQKQLDDLAKKASEAIKGKLNSMKGMTIAGKGCKDFGNLCDDIINKKVDGLVMMAFSKLTQLGNIAIVAKYLGGAKKIAKFLATIDKFASGFCIPKVTIKAPKSGLLAPLSKFLTPGTALKVTGCFNLKAKEFDLQLDLTGGLKLKAGNFMSIEGKAAKANIASKGGKTSVSFMGKGDLKLPMLSKSTISIEIGGKIVGGGELSLYGKVKTIIFSAPVSMSFKVSRKNKNSKYDGMVVIAVSKMGLQNIPGLKSVSAVKNLNVENSFVIASNYDSTWEGVDFKAGLTMHGEVVLSSAGQSQVDSFLSPLKNFFEVKFRSMSLSSWIAAKATGGKRDFSIMAGVKGSVTFKVKIGGVEFVNMGMTDPSAEVWRTKGKVRTNFDFGGHFKLKNIFDMSFKDSPLKLVPGGFVFDIKLPLWGTTVPIFISYGQKLSLKEINAVPPTKLGDLAKKLGGGKVVKWFEKGGFSEMDLAQVPETLHERDELVLLQDTMATTVTAKASTPIYFQIGPIKDVTKITDLMTGGWLKKYLKIGPQCTITVSNYKRKLNPALQKLVGAGAVMEGITIFTSVAPAPKSLFDKLRLLVRMPAAAKGCFAIGSWGLSADMYFPELRNRPKVIAKLGLIGTVSMTLLKFMAKIRFKPTKKQNRFSLALHGKTEWTKTPVGEVAMPDVYMGISDKRISMVSKLGKQTLLKNPDVSVDGVVIALVKNLPGTFQGGFQLRIPSATVPNLLIHALKSIPIKLNFLTDLLKKFTKLLVTPFDFKLSKIELPMKVDVAGEVLSFIEDGFSLDVGAFFLEMIKVVVPGFGMKFPNLGCVLRFTFPIKALLNAGGGTNPAIMFGIENLPTILGRFKIVRFMFQAELQLVPVPMVKMGVNGYVKLLLNNWIGLAMDGSIDAMGTISIGLAMPGMWKQAFGLPFLDIGNLWFRIELSPLAAACPGPCGIKALGMGGEIRFGSTKAAANGYLDFLEPQKMFVNFRGENMGVGTIAGVFKCPKTVQKVANTLFPTFKKLSFTYATTSGAIGPVGAPYPQRINFFAGMQFEADATFIGIHAHAYVAVMLPPQYTLPDFQLSFGLKVPDLIGKFIGIVRKYVPFGNHMFKAVKNVLKIFGINLRLPIFKIDELKLEKFSVLKFVTNQSPFWIKAGFTIFGNSYKGELKFFFKDAIALFKNFPQFAANAAKNIVRELGEKIVKWFTKFRLTFCGLTLGTDIKHKKWLKVFARQEGSFIAKLAKFLIQTVKKIANGILSAFGLGRPFLAAEQTMLIESFQMPVESFSSKTMLNFVQPKTDDFDVDHAANSLIGLLPTNPQKACRVAKKIVRTVGMSKFRKMTSLRHLNCDGSDAMPVSKAQYEAMATRLEASTSTKYASHPKTVSMLQTKAREAIVKQGNAHLDSIRKHDEQARKELAEHIDTLNGHQETMIQETTTAHSKLQHDFAVNLHKDVATIAKVAPTAMLAYQKCVDASLALMMNTNKALAPSLKVHHAKRCQALVMSALPTEAIQIASQAAKMAATKSSGSKAGRKLLRAEKAPAHFEEPDSIVPQTDMMATKSKLRSRAGWHRWRPHVHVPHRYSPINWVERRAKDAARAAERSGKWAERKAKAAERGVKEAARRVERGIKAAANWVKNKIAQFGRWLRDKARAAVNAIRNVMNKAKNAANAVWNKAKAGLTRVWNAAKGAMNRAVKWVFNLVRKLLSYLPQFRYVEFGDIYIQCMVDPKRCNWRLARLPSFKICFSKIGCLSTGRMPRVSELGSWFKTHVLGKIKSWFRNLISWKSFRFNIPNCSGGCFRWKYRNFYYPKPYIKSKRYHVFGRTVTAPYGFGVRNTYFARVNLPSGIKTKNVGLSYPGGLNLSGAKRDNARGKREQAAAKRQARARERRVKAKNVRELRQQKLRKQRFEAQQRREQAAAKKTKEAAEKSGRRARARAKASKEKVGKALKKKHTIPNPGEPRDEAPLPADIVKLLKAKGKARRL